MAQQIGGLNSPNKVRSILVGIWALISTLFFGFASIVLCAVSVPIARKIARFWAVQLLFVSGVKVEVVGLEKLDKNKRYVFIANHQSYFDIPALYTGLFSNLSFIAKKELFLIPFFGWGMAAVGHIWIDRKNARNARKSITRAVSMLKRKKISLVLFPEGTRSISGNVGEFKRASFVLALEAGVPVVPVTICGTRDVQPKNTAQIIPGTVKLFIGDPVPITADSGFDKSELSIKIRAIIVDELDKHCPKAEATARDASISKNSKKA